MTAAPIIITLEKILTGLQIRERDVEMSTATCPVAERLGHEARECSVLANDLIRHQPEEHEVVGHFQCREIIEIDFELTDAILMIE